MRVRPTAESRRGGVWGEEGWCCWLRRRAPWSTATYAVAAASAGGWHRAVHIATRTGRSSERRALAAQRYVRSQRCVPMSRCELGILGRRSARRAIPDGKRLHPRSQPGLLSRRCRLWRPPGCMHWDDALASLHRTGDPRVPCAAVEWPWLMIRCGHGSGTAIGALGRRSSGHPVAAWSSLVARRTQQAQVGADSCAARPGVREDHGATPGRPTTAQGGRASARRAMRTRRSHALSTK